MKNIASQIYMEGVTPVAVMDRAASSILILSAEPKFHAIVAEHVMIDESHRVPQIIADLHGPDVAAAVPRVLAQAHHGHQTEPFSAHTLPVGSCSRKLCVLPPGKRLLICCPDTCDLR